MQVEGEEESNISLQSSYRLLIASVVIPGRELNLSCAKCVNWSAFTVNGSVSAKDICKLSLHGVEIEEESEKFRDTLHSFVFEIISVIYISPPDDGIY